MKWPWVRRHHPVLRTPPRTLRQLLVREAEDNLWTMAREDRDSVWFARGSARILVNFAGEDHIRWSTRYERGDKPGQMVDSATPNKCEAIQAWLQEGSTMRPGKKL